MDYTLDFEKPVNELESQIQELENSALRAGSDLSNEIDALKLKVSELIKDIYPKLTSWERVQLSRHPKRPHTQDYINLLIEDFHEVHGDRRFSDDPSMVTGFGYLEGQNQLLLNFE